jgi:hypothetical protein
VARRRRWSAGIGESLADKLGAIRVRESHGVEVRTLSLDIARDDTPLRQRSGIQDNDLFPVATPEDVAEQALREIGNGPVQVPAGSEKTFATFNIPDRREAVDTIRRLLLEMSVE